MQVIHLSPLVNTTPLPSQGSSALKSALSDQILVVLGLPCSQHPLHPAPRPLFRLQGSTRRKEGINIFKGSLNTLGTFHSSHWDLYQAGITLITVFLLKKTGCVSERSEHWLKVTEQKQSLDLDLTGNLCLFPPPILAFFSSQSVSVVVPPQAHLFKHWSLSRFDGGHFWSAGQVLLLCPHRILV